MSRVEKTALTQSFLLLATAIGVPLGALATMETWPQEFLYRLDSVISPSSVWVKSKTCSLSPPQGVAAMCASAEMAIY